MKKKIKQIPFPDIPGAKVLTPMEMNNLHFMHPGTHTPVDTHNTQADSVKIH